MQAWLNSYLTKDSTMAHLDMPALMQKLQDNAELTAIEREFLVQMCDRLYRTTELDYLTRKATLQ